MKSKPRHFWRFLVILNILFIVIAFGYGLSGPGGATTEGAFTIFAFGGVTNIILVVIYMIMNKITALNIILSVCVLFYSYLISHTVLRNIFNNYKENHKKISNIYVPNTNTYNKNHSEILNLFREIKYFKNDSSYNNVTCDTIIFSKNLDYCLLIVGFHDTSEYYNINFLDKKYRANMSWSIAIMDTVLWIFLNLKLLVKHFFRKLFLLIGRNFHLKKAKREIFGHELYQSNRTTLFPHFPNSLASRTQTSVPNNPKPSNHINPSNPLNHMPSINLPMQKSIPILLDFYAFFRIFG